MRRIDPELQARLDSGATTMCRCWRVRRRDGAEFGFTDHDGDVAFDATTFKASTGMDARAIQSTTGLAVDNSQAVGALSDAGVNEEDVRSGRFDRAKVEHWLVDWSRPDLRVLMFVGHFGEIRRADGAFEIELRGLTEALNAAVGRTLKRSCDRRLGDEKCRFDLDAPGFASEAEVIAATSGVRIEAAGLNGFAPGWFAAGSLTWLTGANAGELASVKVDSPGNAGRRIDLWQAPGAQVGAGDRFRIFAGCDKQAGTCGGKFNNFLNFRGFPDIPGDDWVAAYPKNGEVHDGSSRRLR
ncbi:MAG: DUF2163 domain-containing protein [Rhodobacteraceae bacterium]|nr:DUF2163 domain-containing protein [Paracoccaceae bacterium]